MNMKLMMMTIIIRSGYSNRLILTEVAVVVITNRSSSSTSTVVATTTHKLMITILVAKLTLKGTVLDFVDSLLAIPKTVPTCILSHMPTEHHMSESHATGQFCFLM